MTKPSNAAETTGSSAEASEPRPLLTPVQAAERLGVSPQVLERWRGAGGGPVFVKLSGKFVRYRQQDLDAFVETNCRHSTAG
jgi:predicted site-specific integrase-resolvase